jgi:hypothetical protein
VATSYLKKQSQFGRRLNRRKPFIKRGLWKYSPLWRVKKQSQSKPIFGHELPAMRHEQDKLSDNL